MAVGRINYKYLSSFKPKRKGRGLENRHAINTNVGGYYKTSTPIQFQKRIKKSK
jgi:hypothetical protein